MDTHSTPPQLWLLASVSKCRLGKQSCQLGLTAVTVAGQRLLPVSGFQGCRGDANMQHEWVASFNLRDSGWHLLRVVQCNATCHALRTSVPHAGMLTNSSAVGR